MCCNFFFCSGFTIFLAPPLIIIIIIVMFLICGSHFIPKFFKSYVFPPTSLCFKILNLILWFWGLKNLWNNFSNLQIDLFFPNGNGNCSRVFWNFCNFQWKKVFGISKVRLLDFGEFLISIGIVCPFQPSTINVVLPEVFRHISNFLYVSKRNPWNLKAKKNGFLVYGALAYHINQDIFMEVLSQCFSHLRSTSTESYTSADMEEGIPLTCSLI